MDYREEFDSSTALTDLLQWGLSGLGPTWSSAIDPTAIAAEYRSRPSCLLDPWPAIGLEVHMPLRAGERADVDFSLMAWESPGLLASPAYWSYDATLAPMRIAPTHRFLEFDSQAGSPRYMGQFFSVTDAEQASFPPGLLRDLRRVLGRAPATAALIEGRGGRWPAAIFPLCTDRDWRCLAERFAPTINVPRWDRPMAALASLQAHAVAVNASVAVDESGLPLPMVGFEFFGLHDSAAVRETLAAAGVSPVSIKAFAELQARLPHLAVRSVPLIAGSPIELPWQRRFLHLSHAKLNLRPDGVRLKLYLRLDSAAPKGLTSAGATVRREVAYARSELRRSLRAGSHTDAPAVDAVRQGMTCSDLAMPILRGFWNRALAEVPLAQLPFYTAVARDAVVSAGLRRLSGLLPDSAFNEGACARGGGQQLLHDLGIGDLAYEAPSAARVAEHVRGLVFGQASPAAHENLDHVVIPAVAEWIEGWREIADRVATDRAALWDTFGIPPDVPLLQVDADAGDRHARGRAVHLLWFAVGDRRVGVAYKPRDVRVDAAWYAFASNRLAELPNGALPWPEVLARDGYGYIAHVAATETTDATTYARNAGRILALLHLCDARDVHADNVIHTATGPVPIDLECLWSAAEDRRMVHDGLPIGTVAAIGLLPYWIRTADGNWTNGGGLRVAGGVGSSRRAAMQPPTSAPSLPEAAELRAGFEEMFRQLLTPAGVAALQRCREQCLGAERRRVLRATRVYAGVIREWMSAAPGEAVRTSLRRDWHERLLQSSTMDPLTADELAAEVDAIARGHVPRFVAAIEPSDVCRQPSDTDLQWQQSVLAEWSCAVRPSSSAVDPSAIADWRVSPDGVQGWFGWEGPAAAPVRQLRWLPWTLYAGALGPLLSVAVAHANQPTTDTDRLIEQAVPAYRASAIEALQSRSFRWGLEGLSGHLRATEALLALGVDGDSGMRDVQQAWLAAALRTNPAEVPADYTTGLAGVVGPLCRAYAQTGAGEIAQLVSRLATTLADRLPSKADDPSMAHGSAGIGWALIQAGVALRRDDWIDAACTAWDAAPMPSATRLPFSWCRGLAGLALSRHMALRCLPDHPNADRWQQTVTRAQPALQHACTQTDDSPTVALSLCCGAIGTLAVLRLMGHPPVQGEWDRLEQAVRMRGREMPPGLWTGRAGWFAARHAPHDVLERLIG
jgi:hypothetical protein